MPDKRSRSKRKPRGARKPETDFQKALARLIDEAGMSGGKAFEEKSKEAGWRVPESTINGVLFETTNPGIKTIEAIAHTLGKDPLDVMALALDEPPKDRVEGFGLSRIAVVWELYKQMPTVEKSAREGIEKSITRLIEDMKEALPPKRGK